MSGEGEGVLSCLQMLRVGFEMLLIECSRFTMDEKINECPRCFVLMSITHVGLSHRQTPPLLEGGMFDSAARGRTFLTHPNPRPFRLVV